MNDLNKYPVKKASVIADQFLKAAIGQRAVKPFLDNMATGVAWGLGGAAVDKSMSALSHLFNKRKKPQTEDDREPRNSPKPTEAN